VELHEEGGAGGACCGVVLHGEGGGSAGACGVVLHGGGGGSAGACGVVLHGEGGGSAGACRVVFHGGGGGSAGACGAELHEVGGSAGPHGEGAVPGRLIGGNSDSGGPEDDLAGADASSGGLKVVNGLRTRMRRPHESQN
jgi:hypothetical protein